MYIMWCSMQHGVHWIEVSIDFDIEQVSTLFRCCQGILVVRVEKQATSRVCMGECLVVHLGLSITSARVRHSISCH